MFPIYAMVRGKPRGMKVDVAVRSSSFPRLAVLSQGPVATLTLEI